MIPKWDEFQHYTDGRRLKWIKDWTNQLDNDDYLALSFHLRGVLQSIRVAYALSEGQLLGTTSALYRRLGHRVSTRDLEALNHAGFITFSGTKPYRIRTLREEVDNKDLGACAQKPKVSGAFVALTLGINNGAYNNLHDLNAEIEGRSRQLLEGEPERLRELLGVRYPIREAPDPKENAA